VSDTPTREVPEVEQIRIVRDAARLAPIVIPGPMGVAAGEWLAAEARCHRGARDGGESMQRVVDEISKAKTGAPLPTELRMTFSTLPAAYKFALSILDAAREVPRV
jgi:hypothetical protein